jgi:hypothetical protein
MRGLLSVEETCDLPTADAVQGQALLQTKGISQGDEAVAKLESQSSQVKSALIKQMQTFQAPTSCRAFSVWPPLDSMLQGFVSSQS